MCVCVCVCVCVSNHDMFDSFDSFYMQIRLTLNELYSHLSKEILNTQVALD